MSINCIQRDKLSGDPWKQIGRSPLGQKKKIGNSWIEAICASPCLTSPRPNWSESMEMFYRLNGQNPYSRNIFLVSFNLREKEKKICLFLRRVVVVEGVDVTIV